MKEKNSRCLVLNADYSPLGIIGWQKALVWSLKYQHRSSMSIDIIDFYKDDYIIGINKNYPIPAVVKTNRYFKLHNQSVNFSRKNLYIRDDYTCQYCCQKKDISKLTYDHVIPKSKWKSKNSSPTCWTNIVTACVECNRRKGNKTPNQANMVLKNLPYQPKKNFKYLPVVSLILSIRSDIPIEWKPYLPHSYFE